MHFTPTILPATATPTTRAVEGLTAVHAVKPVHARDPESLPVEPQQAEHPNKLAGLPHADRRMACRRIHHQKVLIELRSGLDRRKHNLFAGGVAEHIDEEV